jgi:hypothetical protein
MKRSVSQILVLLLGALAGCGGQLPGEAPRASQEASVARPGSPGPVVPPAQPARTPEEELKARATMLWEARVKNDPAAQYDLLESKGKEQVTLTGYALSRTSITYLSYQLQEVAVDGDWGQVKAKLKYRLRVPSVSRFGPWEREVYTFWVKEGGGWYLKFNQVEDAQRLKRSGQKQP